MAGRIHNKTALSLRLLPPNQVVRVSVYIVAPASARVKAWHQPPYADHYALLFLHPSTHRIGGVKTKRAAFCVVAQGKGMPYMLRRSMSLALLQDVSSLNLAVLWHRLFFDICSRSLPAKSTL
jgi:hypothetical protein